MSSIDSDYEDEEDKRCSSQRKNSDDDSCQFNHHTHRLCSRNGPCNQDKHQHRSIEPTSSSSRSKRSKFTRGDIRPADNEPGHRVKYDGTRWRRICSVPTCVCYLIGGVYFANWLCRQHYLLAIEHAASDDSNSSAIMSRTGNALTRKRLPQPSARKSCYKVLKTNERGKIVVRADGTREKFDGISWRLACKYENCKRLAITRGCCRPHDIDARQKNSTVLPSSADKPRRKIAQPTVRTIAVSQSKITRSAPETITKPRKGDVQLIRQQWNGTKWYSLCHYADEFCSRRSAGIKCDYLCDRHYRASKEKGGKGRASQNTHSTNRTRHFSYADAPVPILISDDDIHLPSENVHGDDKADTSSPSNSAIRPRERIEHAAQTDFTFPLESADLRDVCIFVGDESDGECSSHWSKLPAYSKKEEVDRCAEHRPVPTRPSLQSSSIFIDCKLELTKIELA